VKIQVKVRALRPATVRFQATVQAQEQEDSLRNNAAAVFVTTIPAMSMPSGLRLFSRG
jgi:hypothetical protein